TAGIHPPDGVIDTTQPDVSVASMDVVPRVNASSNAASAAPSSCRCSVWLPPPDVVGGRADGGQLRSRSRYGFVPPWKGYGSPGLMPGSLRSGLMRRARCRAYSFESRPRIGSSGGNAGSP